MELPEVLAVEVAVSATLPRRVQISAAGSPRATGNAIVKAAMDLPALKLDTHSLKSPGYVTVTGITSNKMSTPKVARGPPASQVVALAQRVLESLLTHGPITARDIAYHISDMPRELVQGAIDVLVVFGIVNQLRQTVGGMLHDHDCHGDGHGDSALKASTSSGGGGGSSSCHYALASFARSPEVPDFNNLRGDVAQLGVRTDAVRKRTRELAEILADDEGDLQARRVRACALLNPSLDTKSPAAQDSLILELNGPDAATLS